MDILASPAFDVDVKASYVDKVRPVLAGHAKTKVPPEACVFLDHQLLLNWGYMFTASINESRVILAEQHRVEHFLTRLCVQSAGVKEVSSEVDVHIAEEQQDIPSFPGSGPKV